MIASISLQLRHARAKMWCFVSNKPQIHTLRQSCDHSPNTYESVVGVRLCDGSFKSRLAAEYPPELAMALATTIKTFTSCSGQKCSLGAWFIAANQVEVATSDSELKMEGACRVLR